MGEYVRRYLSSDPWQCVLILSVAQGSGEDVIDRNSVPPLRWTPLKRIDEQHDLADARRFQRLRGPGSQKGVGEPGVLC